MVETMKLNKFNNEQLELLKMLEVAVNENKKYSLEEIEEILDILTMRINADDGNLSKEANICEDIITIITTDPDW